MEMISKVWQSRFFSFLYIKSKMAFKPSFRTLSKLAEQLKIRVQRDFKKGLYYEINFIFIIFKKLLRHQPGTQKWCALSATIKYCVNRPNTLLSIISMKLFLMWQNVV